MSLGAPLAENRPESSAKPLTVLRLKLKQFKDRLLSRKRHALSPLPDLPWREGDLNDLGALVHDVYMARHEREGTTRGKELLWVDREYQGLRLFKNIGDMIGAVPLRPVAAIQRELIKIDPSYSADHLKLRFEKEPVARH